MKFYQALKLILESIIIIQFLKHIASLQQQILCDDKIQNIYVHSNQLNNNLTHYVINLTRNETMIQKVMMPELELEMGLEL